jgi:hypothetical protein
MPANDWTIGNLYPAPGGIGGFWKQPVPGGLVYPQQVRANSDQLSVEPYCELTGVFIGTCGHSFNAVYVVREFDYDTGSSVALLNCPLCGCIQRTIEPFEDALMGNAGSLQNATLFP